MTQKLILDAQRAQLLANGRDAALNGDGSAFVPVVKFFTPDAAGKWLITEMMEDGDTLFGLCDLGHGTPELGYVSLSELMTVRGRFGLPVERDAHFTGKKSISEYADTARREGFIAA